MYSFRAIWKLAQAVFWIFALISITSSLTAIAQGDDEQPQTAVQRDPAFEQEIYDRLAEIDPDAVPLFQTATTAMDTQQYAQAKRDYESVLELAPDFPDVLRRLSYVESALGNTGSSISIARRAFEVSPEAVNEAALGQALLYSENADDLNEALTHARSAVVDLPRDDFANSVLLLAGWANEDQDAMRQASEVLLEVSPDYPLAHYLAGLLAAEDEEWIRAEEELLRAEELGMPSDSIQLALDDGISHNAKIERWENRGILGLYAIGIWIAGMGVLFVIGIFLSRLTLATVKQHAGEANHSIHTGERLVRTFYRFVIGITSLYYYLSIPILVLTVVLLTAGIFYAFFAIGRIPVRIAFFVIIAALYTLFAVVKSILVRVPDREPGRRLSQTEAPQLWQLTKEVAERVGTRPIDAIYVIPGSIIAVTERGTMFERFKGTGLRCLILGLGALPGMSQQSFKAILSHEYGHFSHRDTAGGGLALQVRLSMVKMAQGLAMSGQARGYNPAWLFVNGFYHIYLRITLGASRLQEILADRYAAIAFGSQNFIDGLEHIVRQGLIFDVQANQEVNAAHQLQRGLQNLYTLPPFDKEWNKKIDARLEVINKRPTSAYDSHPAVQDRIKFVRQLGIPNPDDGAPSLVWDLIPDADKL